MRTRIPAPVGPLPVAVIGAGPIGLVAAAHLVRRGERPLVFEAGTAVGASVRAWGHVRLFSPWRHLTDPVARALLEDTGWRSPDPDRLPTGFELVEGFLEPLAGHASIAPHLRLGRRVRAVSRHGFDKLKSVGRDQAPFELVVETLSGREERHLVRAVIDASGTWATPNPLGSGGVPVPGERRLAGHVAYGIPDVMGRDRARYAGRDTLVVGSGHSAFNALLDLVELHRRVGRGSVTWAVRGVASPRLYGGQAADQLAARGALGAHLRSGVEQGLVRLVTAFRTERLERHDARSVTVHGLDGRRLGPFEQVVVATGFRPELDLTRELRLRLDEALESPVDLAPLIDPNVHSCGTVHPHGYRALSHPERDFFTVGMKSYGRAPTFLLLTGYEQVRSVVAALTGDLDAAGAVELVLPETGVCSTPGRLSAEPPRAARQAAACCA
jgi:hypothetical protein